MVIEMCYFWNITIVVPEDCVVIDHFANSKTATVEAIDAV